MALFTAIGSALAGIAGAAGSGAAAAGTAAGAAGAAAGAAGTGIGLTGITGLIGTGVSAVGQLVAYQGAQKAEELRKRQMGLEIERARRSEIRNAVAARASAMVQGESQGAKGSSALAGGLSQITSSANSNIQGLNQSQEIGNEMFKANSMISRGQTLASIGGAFRDISSQFAQSADQNYRVWGMN